MRNNSCDRFCKGGTELVRTLVVENTDGSASRAGVASIDRDIVSLQVYAGDDSPEYARYEQETKTLVGSVETYSET